MIDRGISCAGHRESLVFASSGHGNFGNFLQLFNSQFFNLSLSFLIAGKSIVDAINGVDKNIILRKSMMRVQEAEDALKPESKFLKVQSHNDCGSERNILQLKIAREFWNRKDMKVQSQLETSVRRESVKGQSMRGFGMLGRSQRI